MVHLLYNIMEIEHIFRELLKSRNKIINLPYKGKNPAASEWHRLRNAFTMLWRGAVGEIIKKLPPCEIKNSIYRFLDHSLDRPSKPRARK